MVYGDAPVATAIKSLKGLAEHLVAWSCKPEDIIHTVAAEPRLAGVKEVVQPRALSVGFSAHNAINAIPRPAVAWCQHHRCIGGENYTPMRFRCERPDLR